MKGNSIKGREREGEVSLGRGRDIGERKFLDWEGKIILREGKGRLREGCIKGRDGKGRD